MDSHIQSLIDALDVATDERMVRNALKNFAVACEYERFSYLLTSAANLQTFNNYPAEWEHLYITNSYSTIDPVVTTAKQRMRTFQWSVANWARRGIAKEQKLFYSQAMDFGIRAGITIPVVGSYGSVFLLTFAKSDPSPGRTVLAASAAERAAMAVHYRLRAISELARPITKLSLSSKEAVCLKWAAKGKYMQEIADVTNIQYRTVQHYLDNARAKLGATNLTHAVALAKDYGLI